MKPITAHIDAVAFAAPPVHDWQALCAAMVSGAWRDAEPLPLKPASLPPRQARRLSVATRLAVTVAEEVGRVLPPDAAWVFASSVGEGETLDVILRSLCEPDMMIQPVKFQNAVHNAASGQWSIAAGLRGPITSIAAYDETFGAGLMKALMQTALEGRQVGLVIYDVPIPVPLDEKRPLGMPMGAALALSPDASDATLATIEVKMGQGAPTPPTTPVSAMLRQSGNPTAACLPLFELLAARRAGAVDIGLHGGALLSLEVTPR